MVMQRPAKPRTSVRFRSQPVNRPGGEIGRRKGLKIPRDFILCRFESGPGQSLLMYLTHFLFKGYSSQLTSRLFATLSMSMALALLIVLSSIFHGFKIDISNKFYDTHPHIYVYTKNDQAAAQKTIENLNEVSVVTKKVYVPVMVNHDHQHALALVTQAPMTAKSAAVSYTLMPLLGLKGSDKIRLSAINTATLLPTPIHQTYTAAIDYTMHQPLIAVKHLGSLAGAAGRTATLEVWLKSGVDVQETMRQLTHMGFSVNDGSKLLSTLMASLAIQKMTLMFVFVLITVLMSLQLLSLLKVMCQSLELPIAYLKTSGVGFWRLFWFLMSILCALVAVSLVIGASLGFILSYYATELCAALESLLGMTIMDSRAFMLDYLPSRINVTECAWILGISFVCGCLVNVYLVRKALKVRSVTVFRRGQYA